MNPIPVLRNFTGSDVFMTENARVTHALVNLDLAKFTAFDNTITATSQTQFLAAINAADTVIADSAVVDQMVQTTETVSLAMEKAKVKYNEVKYFVQKAFSLSPGTQNEFGLNDYAYAKRTDKRMIAFMDEMSKAAVKYQAKLITAGYTAAGVTAIQTIRTELLNANLTQEVFKKQRPKLTEDRIIILNACYSKLSNINAGAQLVYINDFAKQNQFVYNPSSDSVNQEFTGNVAGGSEVVVAKVPYNEDKVFNFKNTGTTPLVFCLSVNETIDGIQFKVLPSSELTKSTFELNENATNLVVRNDDGATVGSYEIEVD